MTTRDEIMSMDEDALNEAVLKSLGYVKILDVNGMTVFYLRDENGAVVHIERPATITDYSRDMYYPYKLEERLPEEKRKEYARWLEYVIWGDPVGLVFDLFQFAHASAADRCRAWLLTMGEG